MATVLYLVALLELAAGVLLGGVTVPGVLAIGFSFLTFGLAALLDVAHRIRRRLDFHVSRAWRDDRLADGFAAELDRPAWRLWPASRKKRKQVRSS